MLQVLQIVLPVCLLILIGFLSRNFGLVRQSADEVIGDFVFKIAIPVLLFRLLATAELEGVDPWAIWGTYFISVAVIWLLAATLLPLLFGREALYGVIGAVASAFANTVLIGIPLVIQAYGEEGMVSLTIVLSIHLPLMLFATVMHHDIAQTIDGKGGIVGETVADKVKRFFKTIFTNPIMLGIFGGGLYRLTGFDLPPILDDVTQTLATIAGPLALIVLGMGLQKYGLTGNLGPACLTTFLKLFVMPALVLSLGHFVFELPPLFTAGLLIAAAAPSGVNSYLFAQHFGTGQALSANSISVSTPLSIVTISIWLLILKTYITV